MMAATQPFLSGAISKTVNLPPDATPDEIAGVYMDGWKQGLKAIAIYRDGCKRTQPLNTAASKSDTKSPTARGSLEYVGKAAAPVPAPFRRKLPDERRSITHKFDVGGHEGYITVGLYEDGKPGEIFLKMSKEGSTVSGLMDAFATAISLTLQYGVPLEALVKKFTHMRFEPAGFTKNPEVPIAKSLVDYVFRWLGSKFLSADDKQAVGIIARDSSSHEPMPVSQQAVVTRNSEGANKLTFETSTDAPACHECGSIMVQERGLLQVPELRGDVGLQLETSSGWGRLRPTAGAERRPLIWEGGKKSGLGRGVRVSGSRGEGFWLNRVSPDFADCGRAERVESEPSRRAQKASTLSGVSVRRFGRRGRVRDWLVIVITTQWLVGCQDAGPVTRGRSAASYPNEPTGFRGLRGERPCLHLMASRSLLTSFPRMWCMRSAKAMISCSRVRGSRVLTTTSRAGLYRRSH